MSTIYISNEEHYNQMLLQALKAKKTLWIGTADLKDLHVKPGNRSVSFLQILGMGTLVLGRAEILPRVGSAR